MTQSKEGQHPIKRLIVTSDDFGAAIAVNEAVEQAHLNGILTAASLMVSGDAAADAVARARTMPKLGVGLHLVLVEGRPTLPPDQVPDLVDADGHFRTDMVRAGITIFTKPAARRQLAAEVEAQFAAFAATGLPLDHVNAHKHFHLHPTVASLVFDAARRTGGFALRIPSEPAAVIHAIEPRSGSLAERIAAPWTAMLAARARRVGLRIADQTFGFAWSGAMTAPRLHGLLVRLPPGVTEIYTHPATSTDFKGAAPGYRYSEELAALSAPETRSAAAASGARLCGFGDLS